VFPGQACGTPVIAAARGAVPEVIEDEVTGFVVPVDLGEIDPKACRRRVEERFTVDRMLDGYEEVYRRAVSGSP
jgi:glycosyltransferase involved in cell wall biosynthesis